MFRRVLLIAVLLMLLPCFACTTVGMPSYPSRRCLFTRVQGREMFQTGSVIAKRDSDDAQLFQYDDSTAGDKGFQWIKDARSLRPCKAASGFDASERAPEAPPWKE